MLFIATLGGGGRAKGFVGPVAPALSKAPALGDGGGRTTVEWPSAAPALVEPVSAEVPDFLLGDEPPVPSVALPPSDFSLGIRTFSLGRLTSDCTLSFRLGGPKALRFTAELDLCPPPGGKVKRCGGDMPCWSLLRIAKPTSIDCERGPPPSILMFVSGRPRY